MNKDTIEVRMAIRDIDAEAEILSMAEPDENGVPCIRVVECEFLPKIEEFLKEQDFFKEDTKDAVVGLYGYMLNNDIPADDAISWLNRIVGAIKNEYGD